MPDFSHTRVMRVPAEDVYDYIADVRNMSTYLPTTKKADTDGPGRVRVQGEVKGRRYDSDGYLRRIDDRNRIEWGADEGDYSGWMEARRRGEATEVSVHLHFDDEAWQRRGSDGPRAEEVQRGLESALAAIEQSIGRHQHGSHDDSQMTGSRNRDNIERL
jgi:uncharacterized protein YndB with AHSA1/START domain